MKRPLMLLAGLALISTFATAQVAMIANPSVTEYTIDRDKVQKFYTLAETKWGDGSQVVLVDLKGEHPVRLQLLDYINREALQLRRLWLKAVASGAAKAPEAVDTEEEVVAKVAATPGAIGYVSASKVGKGVKVLLRFGK